MPDEVLVIIKFRVQREHIEEFKLELGDVIQDFIDETVATQEGDVEVSEIKE